MKTSFIVKVFSKANEDYNTGTGFLVSHQGHICTCNHIVNGATDIWVYYSGTIYDATLVMVDERLDVCLLKIEPAKVELHIERFETSEVGDMCMTVGFKQDSDFAEVETGLILHTNVACEEHFDSFVTNLSGYTGFSGAPIIDYNDKVIGMITWRKQGCSGCANIDCVNSFLQQSTLGIHTIVSYKLALQTRPMRVVDIIHNGIKKLFNCVHGELVISSKVKGVKRNDILLAVNDVKVGLHQSSECVTYNTNSNVVLLLLHYDNSSKTYTTIKKVTSHTVVNTNNSIFTSQASVC